MVIQKSILIVVVSVKGLVSLWFTRRDAEMLRQTVTKREREREREKEKDAETDQAGG